VPNIPTKSHGLANENKKLLTDCCSVSEEEKCRTLDEIQEN
jgi:hypothetical protein